MAVTTQQVAELYVATFNRAPDAAGLAYWISDGTSATTSLTDINAIARAMQAGAEAESGVGSMTNTEYVISLYSSMFGRTVTAADAGVTYWVDQMTAGSVDRANLIQTLIAGAQASTGSATDAAMLANKTTVGLAFAAAGLNNVTDATSVLSGVTADPATVTAAQTSIDNLANPGSTFALTDSTTPDMLIGTTGNDTFTGTAATYANTDRIVDVSTTDNDTFNLAVSDVATPNVTNVENVNVTISNIGAKTLTASSISGAETLTVSRGDVTVGGTTLSGDKTVVIAAASSANFSTVVAGAGTTTLTIGAGASDAAGLVVNADNVSTTVNVDGAATINAANATTTVAINAVTNTTASETGKATTINAANAASVTTHADLTGSVTINAAKATTVTVNDAQGGATVNAGTTSTTTTTITVKDIDASGATITTGTGAGTSSVSTDKEMSIVLDGTALTTDAASIVAGGTVDLDIDGTNAGNVDLLTLSGNGAAVTYNIATPTTGTAVSITKAGTDAVTVAGDESVFSTVTVTNIDTVNLNAGTAGTFDASKFSNVGNVILGFENSNNAITVADAAKFTVTLNQASGLDFDYTTGATGMTIVAGDVNGASNSAVGTLTITGTLDAAAGATTTGTVTIDASEANLTVSTATTLGAKQTLVVTGDEDVSLGTVTAYAVNASASTGNITMTATTGVDQTVTTGTGTDNLTANGADIHSFSAGAGDDTIVVTNTSATSQFDGGEGNDTFTLTKGTTAYVVVGGAGDDSFNVGANVLDAVIVAGDGTDTVTFGTANQDLTDSANFAMTGIEVVTTAASGTTTITAAQFARDNVFKLTGTSATADIFKVTGDATSATETTGVTIDASGITFATTQNAALYLTGNTFTDTITGSSKNDMIIATTGGDTIDGGSGTDTLDLSGLDNVSNVEGTGTGTTTGVVINMGSSAVANTTILAATGDYTANTITSVAAGTMAYLFDAAASTNSAAVSSIANIENVIGSDLGDYIVGNTSGNTITGGAGVDTIVLGGGTDVVVQTYTDVDTTAGAVTDVISGFTSGVDTIKVGTLGGAATYLEAGAAVADLATLLTAAGTALDGTVKIYVGQVGSDSYAVLDDNGTGYTSVIKLAGVALTGVAQADFVV